jgi:hypothetical protein
MRADGLQGRSKRRFCFTNGLEARVTPPSATSVQSSRIAVRHRRVCGIVRLSTAPGRSRALLSSRSFLPDAPSGGPPPAWPNALPREHAQGRRRRLRLCAACARSRRLGSHVQQRAGPLSDALGRRDRSASSFDRAAESSPVGRAPRPSPRQNAHVHSSPTRPLSRPSPDGKVSGACDGRTAYAARRTAQACRHVSSTSVHAARVPRESRRRSKLLIEKWPDLPKGNERRRMKAAAAMV